MSRFSALLLVVLASLQGCATSPQHQCVTPDWYRIGYEDGRQGRVSLAIADHGEFCAERGAVSPFTSYTQGRDEGLHQYCMPGNGFRMGSRGMEPGSVCPTAAEQKFLQAYEEGMQIYQVKSQIRRLEEILSVNESQLRELNESLQPKQAELVLDSASPERRKVLRADTRELEATLEMVKGEILDIQAALREERSRLMSLQQAAGYWENGETKQSIADRN